MHKADDSPHPNADQRAPERQRIIRRIVENGQEALQQLSA
jgi:hypothetical protein